MNVFVVEGRLGRDCSVKSTAGGMPICKFTVANNTGYGDKKHTNWIDCTLFGKRAEGALVQYLVKGAHVIVTGEFNIKQYNKKDSGIGYSHEINVSDVTLIGSNPAGQMPPHNPHQQAKQNGYQPQSTSPHLNVGMVDPAGQVDLREEIPF